MALAEPTAFGAPITYALYAICCVHLILCVVIMGNLVIGTPLDLGGILVSPLVQWLYGSFTLVSIVAIICAGVGALYHIESHLKAYAWVLLIGSLTDTFFFLVFLFYGKSCTTTHGDKNHLVATMSCGLHDGMALLCLTLLVLFKVLALLIVNKGRAHVRSSYNQKLIPFVYKDHGPKQSEPELPIQNPYALETRTLPPVHSYQIQDRVPLSVPQAVGTFPMNNNAPSMRARTNNSFVPQIAMAANLPSIRMRSNSPPTSFLPPITMRSNSPPTSFVPQTAIPQTLPAMRARSNSPSGSFVPQIMSPQQSFVPQITARPQPAPSMRSNMTSFGAMPPPGSMVPSMRPSMGVSNVTYGAAGGPGTINFA